VGTDTVDDRLAAAWEKARRLPDFRKDELVDFIEFLQTRADEDDVWEPDEEEEEAVRAWFEGERPPGIPWEEVKRQSRELGDGVLD